jgi:hypothetical protein
MDRPEGRMSVDYVLVGEDSLQRRKQEGRRRRKRRRRR